MGSTFIVIVFSILILLLTLPYDTGRFTASDGHRRILFLTAHPDDECLFFAPTILGLNRTETNLYALSLSIGNADGLGAVRREEYHRSYDVLGIPHEQRWIVDHPKLQDNFTSSWDPKVISKEINHYILSNEIDTILTFDSAGISSHPNHISLPYGVAHLIQHLDSLDRPTPRLYTLTTVPLFAKYTSILAPLLAKFDVVLARVVDRLINLTGNKSALSSILPVRISDPPSKARAVPMFVSGIPEYVRALKAMRMHESQLVWFRWLYVSFSRYMWVNDWQEVKVQ
ncbi:hypothetical protein AGABI2DRAFT_183645 [Agaricus bisporus var. bisporus H97]|uniref:hypothetical protein n=1 Tax=Agaricus bisporus var. bisporus (strain H97 / ATCC MYA-4626 / FGSC 10389) TaxID=936046 RepID=UPI00029F5188|nr:hypothetical protein AGABI2DRAFT_183645 [Agaricus bisporus var. bisporus H97]EKV50612.1 hypothetical protein AGABI2DRAFT_183645 [Agaricus bisporus var. bisporus H97]